MLFEAGSERKNLPPEASIGGHEAKTTLSGEISQQPETNIAVPFVVKK
jgi:hypothetical protein